MKGIVITTDDEISIRDFDRPLHRTVGEAVGGYIEIVKPVGLKPPFVMVVNDEGLLLDLEVNALGCVLYGTLAHGHPIVGDIVIMKLGIVNGEPDLVGLEDQQAVELQGLFKQMLVRAK
jgi:hypothetical protein